MDAVERYTAAEQPLLRRLMHAYAREFDPALDPAAFWDDDYYAALDAGIAAGTHTIWLAKESDTTIGFALVRSEQHWYRGSAASGIVEEFYVEPMYRRRGVGRALARHAIGDLRDRGATTISLSVVQANLHGLVFWQRLGFTIEAYQLFLTGP